MAETPHADVLGLADEVFEHQLAANPFGATMLGVRDHDHAVPDLSPEGDAARLDALDGFRRRAEALAADGLDDDDRATLAMVRFTVDTARARIDARLDEFSVGPFFVGPQAQVLQYVPKVVLTEAAHAEAYLERCAQLDTFLRQAGSRLREGLSKDRVPTARGVRDSVLQIEAYLASDPADDVLLSPAPPADWTGAAAWRGRLERVVGDVVRPAMAGFRDLLADDVLPRARPDERPGLCWLPDGDATYRRLIFEHTTTDRSADEIHELGLEIVAALAEEYRALGAVALGTSDVAAIFDRLRHDPTLRFSTGEEVEVAARDAVARATAAAPRWFARLPSTPCAVRAIPPLEAPKSAIAYYRPPAVDGSQPGTYYINTSEPTTRTRYEAEGIAFHEAVPGHHLQVALAQELAGGPRLRRFTTVTAYIEGWALYSERLADEMGLYSDALARLGMLSMDSLRAGRLVVDTGLHAKGWSRDRAIGFLRDHSPQAFNNIDNEVDRYTTMPGQALAYMIGRLEIVRLRSEAERRLGDRFDIRAFHDVVLGGGALPLNVLGDGATAAS